MPSSNPYSTGSWFPDLSGNINNFVDNLTRLKMHQGDIDMRGRALQQSQDQFNTELPIKQGQLDVQRGNLAETGRLRSVEEQKQRTTAAQIPDFQKVMNPSDIVTMKITSKAAMGEGSLKVFEPFYNVLNEVAAANPETTRGDVLTAAEQAWPALSEEIATNAEKYMMGPEFEKLKPAQKEAFANAYNAVKTDKTGEIFLRQGVFRNTAASKKQADENQKAALQEGRNAAQEAMLMDRIASAEKISQERIAASEKVNQARIGAAAETASLRARTSEEIAQARLDAARGIADANRNKPTSETELRAQRKELADNESKLLRNKDTEAAGPLADLHNERSEKPYAYIWKPVGGVSSLNPWGRDGEYVQIRLPKIKGKQVTAKDVYDTASQRGMTYEEVLKTIGALK